MREATSEAKLCRIVLGRRKKKEFPAGGKGNNGESWKRTWSAAKESGGVGGLGWGLEFPPKPLPAAVAASAASIL